MAIGRNTRMLIYPLGELVERF